MKAVNTGHFWQGVHKQPQISKDSNKMSQVGTSANRHSSAGEVLATKADRWWKEKNHPSKLSCTVMFTP